MQRLVALSVVFFTTFAGATGSAHADTPVRSGFTGEIGLGASFISETAEDRIHFGITPLSIGVGGFLDQDTALLLRWSGAGAIRNEPNVDGDNYVSSLLGQVGPHLQFFLNDTFMLGLGAGVAVYTRDVEFEDVYTGFVGSVRLGLAFWNGHSATLRITTEALPAVVFDGKAFFQYGQTLSLEWQGF